VALSTSVRAESQMTPYDGCGVDGFSIDTAARAASRPSGPRLDLRLVDEDRLVGGIDAVRPGRLGGIGLGCRRARERGRRRRVEGMPRLCRAGERAGENQCGSERHRSGADHPHHGGHVRSPPRGSIPCNRKRRAGARTRQRRAAAPRRSAPAERKPRADIWAREPG
jgi:hypothetical protein